MTDEEAVKARYPHADYNRGFMVAIFRNAFKGDGKMLARSHVKPKDAWADAHSQIEPELTCPQCNGTKANPGEDSIERMLVCGHSFHREPEMWQCDKCGDWFAKGIRHWHDSALSVEPAEKPDWAGFMEKPLTEAEKAMIPQNGQPERELPPTDAQKQMEHDAGLIGVLFDDKKNLRTERDNWRRKYFEMERAQSRSIDQNGEHIKRIQRLERDKDELRNDHKTQLAAAQERIRVLIPLIKHIQGLVNDGKPQRSVLKALEKLLHSAYGPAPVDGGEKP